MTTPNDDNIGKKYYSISEVAAMFNVTASLIRFWEGEFPHIRPKTNAKGDRRYTQKEIEDIKLIYRLVKEKGYTLQGAKEHINNKNDKKNEEVLDSLHNIRSFLVELKSLLN